MSKQPKDMQSVDEILGKAMLFERTAEEFYASLEDKVGQPIRDFVAELAVKAAEQYNLFRELRKHPDSVAQLELKIQVPADDHKFSDYIHLPDLGENPDDQTILQYALGREDAAARQYADLAKTAPEGPVQDLFFYLSHEVLEHKAELEKRYYELAQSGGA